MRRGAVCIFGVVQVRLVRRERVEVVPTAARVEPREEPLPVEAFLAETPQADRRGLVPEGQIARIECAVLS